MKDAHPLYSKVHIPEKLLRSKTKMITELQKQIRTFCRKLCYLSVRSVRKGTLPFTIPVYGIVEVKPFLMLEAIVSSFI